jgi:hypothetical protein
MDITSLFYQMLVTSFAIGTVVISVCLRGTPDEKGLKFDGVHYDLPEPVPFEAELAHETPPLSFPNRLAA